MQTRLTLQPGQKGTKRLAHQYGDRLVCVRYRYDPKKRRRYKTVELIVDEQAWAPEPKPGAVVAVRVRWGEAELARAVRAAGGEWDKTKKVWRLPYREVVALGLQQRRVEGI
jgi:hypothetical protein